MVPWLASYCFAVNLFWQGKKKKKKSNACLRVHIYLGRIEIAQSLPVAARMCTRAHQTRPVSVMSSCHGDIFASVSLFRDNKLPWWGESHPPPLAAACGSVLTMPSWVTHLFLGQGSLKPLGTFPVSSYLGPCLRWSRCWEQGSELNEMYLQPPRSIRDSFTTGDAAWRWNTTTQERTLYSRDGAG